MEHPYSAAERYLTALDEDWAGLIATVGPCRLSPGAEREPYEALVRAVAHQQLHARAAEAIMGRLLAIYGGTFPTPAQLLATPVEALRASGFSGSKITTIHGIAQGAQDGYVPERDEADVMADEDLITRLVELKGIGRWTVEMLLIFTLERPDVLPVDDFGVREGYRRLKALAAAPKPKVLREIGLAWNPYRTVAAWYLWRVPK